MRKLQHFEGEALEFSEIISMLKSQGLIVDNGQRALYVLGNISYCRLKSYMLPFMEDRQTHRFRPGTTFEQIYAVYAFDRRLRELIFHEMEKIEICVRTRFGYATAKSENGYWFTNPAHFRNPARHARILRAIMNEIDRSDNDAILHFREKYVNDFPPCWLTMEATSMGTLWTIYHEMTPGPDKDSLASYFGLHAEDFSSWLKHLVYVRNYCAHHNRLWDKYLTTGGSLPEWTKYPFPSINAQDTHHIYFTCCVLKYLLDTVRPGNSFFMRLTGLIDGFPAISVERPMGFPPRWREEKLWSR